jgi:DNA-binding NarL/FixJ family response regulator
MPIHVCIVEDNAPIRQALEQVLALDKEYLCLGAYPSAEIALEKIPALEPDVVLMDIHLGGMSGIECVRRLKAQHPKMLFMMCTVYEEDDKIFDALKAGASGYILKKTQPQRLMEAIKELLEGGAPMSSSIAAKVVGAFREKPAIGDEKISDLTNREREILNYLAKGLLYKEISAELTISQETVRKHVYRIYEKLHVSNRVEAINKLYGR